MLISVHVPNAAAPLSAFEADAPPRRAPADDTRARLLGELMKKKEQVSDANILLLNRNPAVHCSYQFYRSMK